MEKDLHTLIRLNEWTVDERRRELADVLSSLASLEDGLERLRLELIKEQAFVKNSPGEAGFFYGNYANAVIHRREHLNQGIARMERDVAAARERVNEAYRELKKYQVAQEVRDLNQAREEARKEQIELDEMALQTYRRNQG